MQGLLTSAFWQRCRFSTCKSFSPALTRKVQCRCTSSPRPSLPFGKKKRDLICCRGGLSREDMESEAGELYGAPGVRKTKGRSRSLLHLIWPPHTPTGSRRVISPATANMSHPPVVIGSRAPFHLVPISKAEWNSSGAGLTLSGSPVETLDTNAAQDATRIILGKQNK